MIKEQKCIVLSGANSGIGEALAHHYATKGTLLYLTARNQSRLESVAARCRKQGAEVHIKALDIRDTTSIQDWIKDITATQSIDLLIANAGIMFTHADRNTLESAEAALEQIETNLGGTINLTTALAPGMQARKKGHIALIASLAGRQPLADLPGYSASKAGVIAYGEALHAFLAKDGITVSTICPGYISTPMTRKHENWRPLEMSAEKAAVKIARAIERKRVFYEFPFLMSVLVGLGRFVPAPLRRYTTTLFSSYHQ